MTPISVPQPARLAVFASGGGSNLGAILEAIDRGEIDATVALVVADRLGIGALDRAAEREIETAVLSPADFDSAEDFGAALLGRLREANVSAIALAGYLKRIPEGVVEAFRHRILNVHPSLLPAFGGAGMYGTRVHRAVMEHGCRVTGATVHLVDTDYDTGPIVLQEAVPILATDTVEDVAARVLWVEHWIFPQAVGLLVSGELSVDGRRVEIGERRATETPEGATPEG